MKPYLAANGLVKGRIEMNLTWAHQEYQKKQA